MVSLRNMSLRAVWIHALTAATLTAFFVTAGAAAQEEKPADAGGAEAQTADSIAGGPARVAIILDSGGRVVIETLPEDAPGTVDRFLALVRDGFYNGVRFHRVEEFLVQAGKKENEYPTIEGEMFDQNLTHEPGMVGMARLPDNYDSATTQFYIMKKHKANFNGEYTLFGRVVEGMDLVTGIKKDDRIERMEITR